MTRSEQSRSSGFARLAGIAGLFILLVTATQAHAQTFTVLHSFSGSDGGNPVAGLTIDRAGNLYGTTEFGGNITEDCAPGCGTVFKLAHAGSGWVLHELYKFSGSDGGHPEARVIFGADGTLYGDSYYTVFNLRPPATVCASFSCPWEQTVLFTFTGYGTGSALTGDLAFDAAGNIYGTTQLGGDIHFCEGLGCGTVYQLTESGGVWTENILHEFVDAADGEYPNSGVIIDQAGNLYGTAPQAGLSDGTVFELSPSGSGWTFNLLYAFQDGTDGGFPHGGLILDGAGNLYGATSAGGSGNGGTVFELSPSNGNWDLNVLYGLTGVDSSLPGPAARLLMDSAGNLYGSSVKDGAYGYGSVFKLTPSNDGWTYTSLHDFTGGSDGAYPYDGLALDASGNLYGTTEAGGNSGSGCEATFNYQCGVVFEITP